MRNSAALLNNLNTRTQNLEGRWLWPVYGCRLKNASSWCFQEFGLFSFRVTKMAWLFGKLVVRCEVSWSHNSASREFQCNLFTQHSPLGKLEGRSILPPARWIITRHLPLPITKCFCAFQLQLYVALRSLPKFVYCPSCPLSLGTLPSRSHLWSALSLYFISAVSLIATLYWRCRVVQVNFFFF